MSVSTGMRTRICEQCSAEFSYEIGRGSDRRLCSDACRTRRRHANAKTKPLCVVEGCKNNRGYSDGTCNSCYYRLRRTGTLEKRAWKYRSLRQSGYVSISDKTHELSGSSGLLYEHRKVLFDAIGRGPHSCHWCGCQVEWRKRSLSQGTLVPDHLDGNKSNNALSNLVPACNKCNGTRGLFMAWVRKHRDDPWLWAMYETARAKRA